MDLRVRHYERKVEGNISVEEYPIRDILVSDQEWGQPQRWKKYGTKIEYTQDTPFSHIFFWPARCFRSITRISARFWGHFSYSCLLVPLSRASCVLVENCWWYLFNIGGEGRANTEKSWGNIPQPLQEAWHIWKLNLWMRQEREKEAELRALIK